VRARRDLFESAFAFGSPRFNVAHGGQADFVEGLWASGEFFSGLGVPAILGRTLGHADDRRGGGPDGPVMVISYDYWRRRFGGATDVIGRSITIERVPFTVVGVTPEGFFGPNVGRRFDVAIPIGTAPLFRGREKLLDQRSFWWLSIMVRLKDGESRATAQRALRGVQPQIAAATLPEHARREATHQYLAEPFTLTPGAAGVSSLRFPIPAAGDHTDGGGGPRASDRVREYRQPPPRARHRPTP
jgi:putative ABC transport system permease protein